MLLDPLITLLPFACIASFTPGPNNIMVMSQGINHGLRSTFTYQIGAGVACFVIIFACIVFGSRLEQALPSLVSGMKYIGSAYMLWLAWLVATAIPGNSSPATGSASFRTGFLLQFVNPKYYLYVVTLASVLIPATRSVMDMLFYAFFFSFMAVAGMFAWAASGALLQRFLLRWHRLVNIIMGLALVWSAWSVLQT